MMRARFLLVLTLSFLLLFNDVAAQDLGAEEWFLALRVTEGDLVSFTPDGDVTTLIDGSVTGQEFRAWRMDDGSALAALVMADSGTVLVQVTADEATIIELPEEISSAEGTPQLQLLAHQGNYAVIVDSGDVPSGAALLIDLSADSATLLGDEVSFFPDNSAAFSEDGLYLRYLLRDPDNEETWTIQDRKLETGAERVIYTIENAAFPFVSVDAFGENWLYRGGMVTTLIPQTGEAETIVFESLDEAIGQQFFDNFLVSQPLNCREGCMMELVPIGEVEALQLTIPNTGDLNIVKPLAWISESQLLVMIDAENLWLLSTDGTSQNLGVFSSMSVLIQPDQILSPDERWLLTWKDADDITSYQVWDLEQMQTVVEGNAEGELLFVQIWYGAGGFVVVEGLQYFQYYRSRDGQLFNLEADGGVYPVPLADGTLLYNQYVANEEQAKGMYHYDPDTETYTLLVDDAVLLQVADAG
jgi:hypothetical protein